MKKDYPDQWTGYRARPHVPSSIRRDDGTQERAPAKMIR